MNVIYGIVISPRADRYIDIAEKALEGMAKAAAPGAFLVDVFPWCECCSRAKWYPIDCDAIVKYVPDWMPGAGFQKKAANWKKYVLEMRDAPFAAVQKALVSICWQSDVGQTNPLEGCGNRISMLRYPPHGRFDQYGGLGRASRDNQRVCWPCICW
jgi:hypothetical protein